MDYMCVCSLSVAILLCCHVMVTMGNRSVQLTDDNCRFRDDLLGPWYQKDYGNIVINGTSMTGKGDCVQRHQHLLLLYNKKMNCYLCLEIYQRGHNVLQYREGFCNDNRNLNITCSVITPNHLVHTMLRVEYTAQPCPFSGAYHFSYNNHSGGFCRDPMSYARSCAGTTEVRFHFSHCTDISYSYGQVWDLECLGSWTQMKKDRELTYMYGRFRAPHLTKRHLMYRCILYEMVGTVVYLSVSGDSTCMGILSSRDGPIVMELTKDIFGWPQPSCHFPAWMSKHTWRDLPGDYLYLLDRHKRKVDVSHYTERSGWQVHSTLRCVHHLTNNSTTKSYYAVSFTSYQCEDPVYECVHFTKKKDGILEYHKGGRVSYDTDPCYASHFARPQSHLLMASPSVATTCPLGGVHRVVDEHALCEGGGIQIGCDVPWVMTLNRPCTFMSDIQLECLHTWRGKRKTYIIATRLGNKNGIANCFAVKRKGSLLHFAVEESCNFGAQELLRKEERFIIDPMPDTCPPTPTFPSLTESPVVPKHNNIERSASSARKENAAQHTVEDNGPALPLAKSAATTTAAAAVAAGAGAGVVVCAIASIIVCTANFNCVSTSALLCDSIALLPIVVVFAKCVFRVLRRDLLLTVSYFINAIVHTHTTLHRSTPAHYLVGSNCTRCIDELDTFTNR